MSRKCVLGTLLVVVLLVSAGTAFGQDVTASLTGTVTDPTGAAVAGAKVTAKDAARGTTWATTTSSDGAYYINRVAVGTYDLRVEAAGFQTALQAGITLVLNQTARLDIQLKVGQVTQVVEVSGAPPVLQTDATQLGTVIDSRTNDNLPLATRNYVQLTLLAPGSVTPNPSSFNNGDNTANGGRPYINGNREQSNNFLLDGMDNNQVSDNLLGYTPTPDAIQEFNLITNNASAEFGNFQGGVVSATIKSGTNSFHGDVWEFFRNDKLNANSWENNFSGSPKNKVRWNMFGATLGGPVLKSKLFFFVDYQGQRFDHPTNTQQFTVMTAAERGGNFGAQCGSGFDASGICQDRVATAATPSTHTCGVGDNTNGCAIANQLYDPSSIPANCVRTGTGANCPQPTAFANNVIPIARINAVAQALFNSSFYPAPINGNPTNNLTYQQAQAFNADQGDIKIDYVASDKERLSGRFSRAFQTDPTSNTLQIIGNGFGEAPIWNTVVDWNRSLGPTLINDLRFGWNHVTLHNGGAFDPSVGTLGETLGIPGSNPNGLPGLLAVSFTGGSGSVGTIGNSLNEQNFNDQVYQFDEAVIWSHNRHSFHFGFQYWKQIIDTFYSGNSGKLGGIAFSNTFTADPTNAGGSTGGGLADFFLGLPTNFGRGVSSGGWIQSSKTFAGYAQDDWRVTDRLTLNVGLRYEAHTPWVEASDRQVNFGLLSGDVQFAGVNGNSRGLYNGQYGRPAFQPRLGFAWTPAFFGRNTVIRGAYTISSYLEGTGTNLRLTLNPPFSPAEFLTQYGTAGLPGSTTDQGIIAPPAVDPSCPNLICYDKALIRVWDPNVQPAISQQWNLTVQRQFWGNTTAQLGYVGQHGTHLMVPMPYAQRQLNPDGTVSKSIYVAGNPTLQNEISQISGTASNGNMRYDALQGVIQKQMSNGLQYQVAYTYSKCMTNSSGYYGSWGGETVPTSPYFQNVYNPKAEWGPCYYDTAHVVSGYSVYELPVGRGKKYGNDMNPVLNAIVGGWSVSPIISWHTGFALTMSGGSNAFLDNTIGSRGVRPDCIAGPKYLHGVAADPNITGNGVLWFDKGSYQAVAPLQFGTCGVGTVRGPRYGNVDLSLHKDFKITETKSIQFRSDFLNTFNHVNYNAPNTGFDPGATSTTGLINSSQAPRNIQFALKFYY